MPILFGEVAAIAASTAKNPAAQASSKRTIAPTRLGWRSPVSHGRLPVKGKLHQPLIPDTELQLKFAGDTGTPTPAPPAGTL
ncbi:hypothetical protein [Mycobacterium camsae]|uniref:hypothetical protein n=1 Tax=Mycobacterium gordonae TaxID=1778 RepID=UPI00197E08E8|nr:hypothetical protein [Mycobacterium gordonae]